MQLLPISACWTFGFLATNLSLGLSSVSFNHAVKAAEPLFLVVISTFVFGKTFSMGTWLSLMPITAGIALVSMTELSFSPIGFFCACFANCCFVVRSVFAKELFANKVSISRLWTTKFRWQHSF